MANNSLFKITVLKWFEHNPNAKKTYKRSMIQHSLVSDAKINAMPLSHKWLFINMLLICGDHANDTITLTQRQLNDILTTREGAHNALARLQSFQLITYEEIALIEVKEKKRRVTERKEVQAPREVDRTKEISAQIWETYKTEYLRRYKTEPVRNASVNSKISQLAKRLGFDAVEVVKFFLTHNDQFYVKSMHSIGLCLANAEALHTQWKRGRAITGKDAKNFEANAELARLGDDLKAGGF